MKINRIKLYITSVGLLLICVFLPAYAQKWTPNWQHESRAYTVKFIDENNGYMTFMPHDSVVIGTGFELAFPTYGLLLKTTNGGHSWSEHTFDSLPRLLAMDFADINNGFVCAQGLKDGNSYIHKTTNAGTSWSRQTISGIKFTDIDVIDNNHSVLIGRQVKNGVVSRDTSLLLSSTNNGQNYTHRKLGFAAACFSFVDANTGFMAATSGKIYKTTDAGAAWVQVNNTLEPFNKMYFANVLTGFVISATGKVYHTTNGGQSWAATNLGNYNLRSITFSPQGNGYICATEPGIRPNAGFIFQTTDVGSTWSRTLTYTKALMSISFPAGSVGYAIGHLGHLIKTTNAGQTYTPLMGLGGTKATKHLKHISVHFPTNNTGYMTSSIDQYRFLSKSTNGGQTWLTRPIPFADQAMNAIFFTDSLTGYIGGVMGNVFKTTNGGQSWMPQFAKTFLELNTIVFVSEEVGFASAGKTDNTLGSISKTTDGGASWNFVHIAPANIKCIWFVNPQVGYAGTGGAGLLKTTDQGASWQPTNSAGINTISSITFKNINEGYFLGEFGNATAAYTHDGGASWQTFTPNVPNQNTGVSLSNLYCSPNECYFIGHELSVNQNRTIALRNSTSTHTEWIKEQISIPINEFLFSSFTMSPNKTFYAVSDRGVLLKRYSQIATANPKPKPKSAASLAFELFPNPSYGQCQITTQSWQGSMLSIIDGLGRNRLNLALTSQTTHIKLEKGVYFVRLLGSEGSAMQKLIVY